MKIESTAFSQADVDEFFSGLVEHERGVLADRLDRASARLAGLGARLAAAESGRDEEHLEDRWNATEVLAHIAVLSKFYGTLTYKIGTGQLTEMDLLGGVHLRDVVGEQLAQQDPSKLVADAIDDHRRTAAYLRSADATAMQRQCVMDGNGKAVTAADVARLSLVAHLEVHLDQLERAMPD